MDGGSRNGRLVYLDGGIVTISEIGGWLDRHAAPLVSGTRQQGIWFVSVSNRMDTARGSGTTLEGALRSAMERWCYECGKGTCDR